MVSVQNRFAPKRKAQSIPTLPEALPSPCKLRAPPPYGVMEPPGCPNRCLGKGLPDSKACMASIWRMDSGRLSQSSPVSMLFFAINLIFARLRLGGLVSPELLSQRQTSVAYLFWNQIWTDRSVMLISCAIRSRAAAVGVGFLLNSTSRVTN